jgi:putative ABC transport system permease protein
MFRNYLRTAINSIVKNKFFSSINILGLALGITVSLLILMYVVNELSYESFQTNRKNIYRVALEWGTPGSFMKFAGSMPALAAAIDSQIPEVKSVARIRKSYDAVIKTRDNQEIKEENLFFADPDILKIFTFSFQEGVPEDALKEPFKAVITKRTAAKYFGNADPLGKELSFKDTPLRITGIIDNIPENTHFQCDILVSYSTLKSMGETIEQPWNQWGDDLTYILLKNDESVSSIIPKLNDLLLKNAGEWLAARMKFDLQPLTQIHWDTDTRGDIGPKGNKTYVYIFLSAAIFILIIACFNFLNLSISRYLGRMTEVAIRKTAGARRNQLIFQFLTETTLIVIISSLIAVFLFEQFYSNLYSYLNTAYVLANRHFLVLTILVFLIVIMVGIAAGTYPAFYISRLKPIEVLRKETYGLKSKFTFRRFLVMLQFAISIILLVGTIIIFRQLNYMKKSDLGFNKENVLLLNFPGLNEEIRRKYDVLRDELLKNSNIRYVSGAYTLPGVNSRMNISVRPAGTSPDNSINIQALPADYGFVRSLQLEIIDGRDFSQDFSTDRYKSVLLNQAAVNILGLEKPLGTRLMIPGEDYKNGVTVIGIVKDFHIESFHEKIDPILIYINPEMYISIAVRINPSNSDETLAYIKNVWNTVLPGSNFNLRYLENAYNSLYSTEEKSGLILSLFTVLAIFISCLGLFGFASFVIGKKIKEVGIRKVMGARALGISLLLSRQFTIWILISSLIACPAAYLLVVKWLGNFAYHIKTEWWIFAAAVCSELVIALLTVTLQTWRAATRNPVEALRYE